MSTFGAPGTAETIDARVNVTLTMKMAQCFFKFIQIQNERKQGRIHSSISRVRVGRGSMVAGQGQ